MRMRNAAIQARPTKVQPFKEDDCTLSAYLSLLVNGGGGGGELQFPGKEFLTHPYTYSIWVHPLNKKLSNFDNGVLFEKITGGDPAVDGQPAQFRRSHDVH